MPSAASAASQARKSAGRSAANAGRSGSPPKCRVRKPRNPARSAPYASTVNGDARRSWPSQSRKAPRAASANIIGRRKDEGEEKRKKETPPPLEGGGRG